MINLIEDKITIVWVKLIYTKVRNLACNRFEALFLSIRINESWYCMHAGLKLTFGSRDYFFNANGHTYPTSYGICFSGGNSKSIIAHSVLRLDTCLWCARISHKESQISSSSSFLLHDIDITPEYIYHGTHSSTHCKSHERIFEVSRISQYIVISLALKWLSPFCSVSGLSILKIAI